MESNASSQDAGAGPLEGIVDRVIFHNEDNGFTVLRLTLGVKRELATMVGFTAKVRVGDHVSAVGHWANDKVRGMQFRADEVRVVPPNTLDGVKRYLASGMVPGIGPHLADMLIEAFGERVFDVIDREPERLDEVDGIGPKRKAQILTAWQEQRVVSQIMVFLQSHGVGPGRAVRIYKTYGDRAVEIVRQNPYRLAADVHGIGFKLADELATRLGLPHDSPMRARAGVAYVLQTMATEGHCAVTRERLLEKTEKLLAIPPAIAQMAIEELITKGELIAEQSNEQEWIYSEAMYHAEAEVAAGVNRLRQGSPPWWGLDVAMSLPSVERQSGIQLSATQREAVHHVVANKVAVITGGPGVGKTTVVNSILKVLCADGVRVLLCAPTGRAAKRLSESTGMEAKTIHRLLEFDPVSFGFKHDAERPLETDLVVVDECSMVDIHLMRSLLAAIPDSAALLLVGDVDQLPSVGPGAVLADIINSNCVSTVRLTEIFRQAAASQIIVNAHRIHRGEMPQAHENQEMLSDFYFIPGETPEDVHDKLMQLVIERIPKRFGFHPYRDIQVLTPMNKGGLGTRALNTELQQRLNTLPGPRIERFGVSFGVGDKVIQTVNNYEKEVFNGDIGFIEAINAEDNKLQVSFDGRSVEYLVAELDELALAYATTIHKSQGSEYPAVVIPLTTQHYALLERNLLYTAVTRGKKLVVVVGQSKALRIAVDNVRASQRMTRLRDRIQRLRDELSGQQGIAHDQPA